MMMINTHTHTFNTKIKDLVKYVNTQNIHSSRIQIFILLRACVCIFFFKSIFHLLYLISNCVYGLNAWTMFFEYFRSVRNLILKSNGFFLQHNSDIRILSLYHTFMISVYICTAKDSRINPSQKNAEFYFSS